MRARAMLPVDGCALARLVISFAVPALLGCSSATGGLQGGDPLTVDPCQLGGTHGGNRWQDLYLCYFGPGGKASCGSHNGCHSTADDVGAVSSGGFVCGPNQEGCWQGMTNSILGLGSTAPKSTLLYGALRKADGTGGQMPLSSTYAFQGSDLARIGDWIQQGAPNN